MLKGVIPILKAHRPQLSGHPAGFSKDQEVSQALPFSKVFCAMFCILHHLWETQKLLKGNQSN
jgi:hypothetical protein